MSGMSFLSNLVPPAPGTATPSMVGALDGTPGASGDFAPIDHVHPIRVQRTTLTLGTDSTATWTFTKPFSTKPVPNYMCEVAGLQPCTVEVLSFTTAVSNGVTTYTGMVVKGYKAQKLPAVMTLLTALLSYDVFAGSAAGTVVHVSAGPSTQ
jgi:hypothetical protein